MRIAVIYKSKYGTTKRYAEWIADDLGADLLEHATADAASVAEYDVVVYGGGIYASSIIGVKLPLKAARGRLVVFTVDLADPASTEYTALLAKNIPADRMDAIRFFHLRGGIDYRKLGLVHRGVMAVLKRVIAGKSASKRTPEHEAVLATYGGQFDFTNRESTVPLVEYVRQLGAAT